MQHNEAEFVSALIDRRTRRALKQKGKGKSNADRLLICRELAHQMVWPLTDTELAMSDEIIASLDMSALYHGGIAGLKSGDDLLPAGQTGMNPRKNMSGTTNRFEFVYFTSDLPLARSYAGAVKGHAGAVYRVEPVGRAQIDSNVLRTILLMSHFIPLRENGQLAPGAPIAAFCAPSAKVVSVIP
jgi:hypothetical protein